MPDMPLYRYKGEIRAIKIKSVESLGYDGARLTFEDEGFEPIIWKHASLGVSPGPGWYYFSDSVRQDSLTKSDVACWSPDRFEKCYAPDITEVFEQLSQAGNGAVVDGDEAKKSLADELAASGIEIPEEDESEDMDDPTKLDRLCWLLHRRGWSAAAIAARPNLLTGEEVARYIDRWEKHRQGVVSDKPSSFEERLRAIGKMKDAIDSTKPHPPVAAYVAEVQEKDIDITPMAGTKAAVEMAGDSLYGRFSESSRRVVFFARYEACQSGGARIKPYHLLLGLLRESKPLIARNTKQNISATRIRQKLEELNRRVPGATKSEDPMLHRHTKGLLRSADGLREQMGDTSVEPKHLLVSLFEDPNCPICYSAEEEEVLIFYGLRREAIIQNEWRGVK